MFKRIRGESGFTLVELLVVLAILAILIAVVVPNLAGLTGGAQTVACDQEGDTVQQAMDTLMTRYSADSMELVTVPTTLDNTTVVSYVTHDGITMPATMLLRKETDGTYTWISTGLVTQVTCPYTIHTP